MAKFKKGDVCIMVNGYNYPELNCEEVTVITDLIELNGQDKDGTIYNFYGYMVDKVGPGGKNFGLAEYQLRLKDAPPDAIVMREYNRLIEKITGKVPA